MDDPKVYELLKSGKTLGVFQVESYLFRELLKSMQPDNFEDIAALIALGRPGPLDAGMDRVYISNKHGYTNIEYPHELLEPVLSSTQGIFLYQEQVLSCSKIIGGLTPKESYDLMKGLGKKRKEIVEAFESQFKDGALSKNIDLDAIDSIWHQMETFARYGSKKISA